MIHPPKNPHQPPYHLQDILVHRGEPQDHNPYLQESLTGEERIRALDVFRQDLPDAGVYTFWYAPPSGGARRLTAPGLVAWTPGDSDPPPPEWVNGKFVFVEPRQVQDFPTIDDSEQLERLFRVERYGPDFKDLVKSLCEIPPASVIDSPPNHEQIFLRALLGIQTRIAVGPSYHMGQEVQDIITKALKETGHGV